VDSKLGKGSKFEFTIKILDKIKEKEAEKIVTKNTI
jgi:hypothetical protein